MLQNPKKYYDVIICKKKISKFYVKSAMLLDNAYSKTCVSLGKRLTLYRKGLYDIFYNPLLIAYVESFSDISFPTSTNLLLSFDDYTVLVHRHRSLFPFLPISHQASDLDSKTRATTAKNTFIQKKILS